MKSLGLKAIWACNQKACDEDLVGTYGARLMVQGSGSTCACKLSQALAT